MEDKKTLNEPDSDQIKKGAIVISDMIREEEELEKEANKEEERIKQEHDEVWKDLDEEDREHRYQRLQFLLSKSNLYTQYLLSRMEKQKEEQAKRADRIKKKKEKEDKKKEEEKKIAVNNTSSKTIKEELSNNSETLLLSITNSTSLFTSEGNNKETPTTHSISTTGPRRTTRGNKPGTPNSQDSQSSQGSRRGRKRKVDSSYNASDISKFCKKSEEEKNKSVDQEMKDEEDKENEVKSVEPDGVISKTESTDRKQEKDVMELHEAEHNGKPKLFTGGELREYQVDGYNWLKVLYENGVNGILADEMGLGKTVQCIAMMSHLVNMGVPGPFLVVVPLSTLPNWYSEFQRFAPKVPVVMYHGNAQTRMSLRRKIHKKYLVRQGVDVRPVVLTSYEITIRDRKLLQNCEWKYLIVDEGHRIKNINCRLIRELRLYRNTHRLLLTGTPLQNNLSELWSLLNFLLPEIFDDLGSFEAWFDVERMCEEDADKKIVQEEQQKNILSMLHQILTPFMLRRLKQDVDLKIPPKKEVLVYAPLTIEQSKYYEGFVNRTIVNEGKDTVKETVELNDQGRPVRRSMKKKIDYDLMIATKKDLDDKPKKRSKYIEQDEEELESWVQSIIDTTESFNSKSKIITLKTSQSTLSLQNIMMQLRKCCNHPYLLEYPLTDAEDFRIDEELVTCCGKMLLLDRMLNELNRTGHKVLIFSQMTKMLDILGDYCYMRQYKYCRLDGSYSIEERKEQMDAFREDKDIFIFLLSTRAGGLGINLTAADTVILYDSDWNPQCDLQAQDRCHRIGQTQPVVVYRFVTANTIDQRIVERAAAKRKLEKMVIHKEKFKTGIKDYSTNFRPLTPQELQDLLKSRDHQMEMKGDDDKSGISDHDLKILLDRSDLIQKWEAKSGEKTEKMNEKATKLPGKGIDRLFKVLDNDYDEESITEEELKQIAVFSGQNSSS